MTTEKKSAFYSERNSFADVDYKLVTSFDCCCKTLFHFEVHVIGKCHKCSLANSNTSTSITTPELTSLGLGLHLSLLRVYRQAYSHCISLQRSISTAQQSIRKSSKPRSMCGRVTIVPFLCTPDLIKAGRLPLLCC